MIRKALREGSADLRIRVAIGQYQSGSVSVDQAARIAGLFIADWLTVARERNLTTQLSPDNFEVDAEIARDL